MYGFFQQKMHSGVLTQWFVVGLGTTPAQHLCRAVAFPWIQAAPGADKANAHQDKTGLKGINRGGKGDKRYKNITLYLQIVKAVEQT